MNSAGGGGNPQYTFAKDAGFTNILQETGVSNTLTPDPSSLVVGADTIYVKMTTSDTCYTTLNAVNSIIITRSADIGTSPGSASGLTDPDFPNQLIGANPNPFFNKLSIIGLQSAKTYTATLIDGTGHEVLSERIGGRQNYDMTIYPSKGVYLLRVYDESRKRLIGTIRLVALGH